MTRRATQVEYYAFVDQTFWEYFYACSLVWQFEQEQTISLNELIEEVFGQHWQDEKWHQVLQFIARSLEPQFVGEIISYLIIQDGEKEKSQNLFLATKCFFEVKNSQDISDVGTDLLNELKYLADYHQYEPLLTLKRHWNLPLRFKALQQIAIGWKDDPETLPYFKRLIECNNNSHIRFEAVRQIATVWKDAPETLPFLKQLVESSNWQVPLETLRQIAIGWKDEPETLPFLKHWAVVNDDSGRQREAVRQIAIHWKDDPETLSFLLNSYKNDGGVRSQPTPHPSPSQEGKSGVSREERRRTGEEGESFLFALAERSSIANYPDMILPILKQYVESDNPYSISDEAVRKTATAWKHDLETLPFLKQLVDSNDWNIQEEETVRKIATGWKDDQETLPFLKEIVQSDNWEVGEH
ncbi:MAG: hypothetical protein F6K39_06015 [Okeania sp. SIO3B3]|nr:hypothetical protein [Okeania sp. SIO3B3]